VVDLSPVEHAGRHLLVQFLLVQVLHLLVQTLQGSQAASPITG
jgi:hypothetical protein